MQWIKVSAAFLILSAVTSQADAGLFDCCRHHEPACCAPAPTCCDVEPSCHAPLPVYSHAQPTCDVPVYSHAQPSCNVPMDACCEPVYDYCPPPKKRCCLLRLWDCEKRKNRWIMNRMGW